MTGTFISESYDLVVVGAGPGGLAAAATAAQAGMSVCLIDDNPVPGGQIWRSSIDHPPSHPQASAWIQKLEAGRVAIRSGWRVVDAAKEPDHETTVLRLEQDGQLREIEASSVILATGARELFLPFPGWTLPGVYGVGGLQAFVKSGLDVAGKRVVIAGTGPLLLAVAAGLKTAGARILTVVEQAPAARLATFSCGLLAGHAGKLVEGAAYAWKTLGIPYRTGSWVSHAGGEGHLENVQVTDGKRSFVMETDMLAVGFHLVPNTEIAQLLHCQLQDGYMAVDELQQTSRKHIYCVGETTGIGGVEKAQIEGRIAALAACGKPDQAQRLHAARDRQWRFVTNLARTFRLREELLSLASDETVLCRCEDVTHGELKGCRSWREAKLHTRSGMGPCQGRICAAAARVLYGWESPQPRPPLFPVEVRTLAGMGNSNGAERSPAAATQE